MHGMVAMLPPADRPTLAPIPPECLVHYHNICEGNWRIKGWRNGCCNFFDES